MGDYGRGYPSDSRSHSGDRGMQIVVRRSSFSGDIYPAHLSRPRSPGWPPVPPPRKQPSHGSGGSIWGINDPETKRRMRVASYKAYSFEGRFKASMRSGFRWIKIKCSELVHGW